MKKITIFNSESAYYYFTDAHYRDSILGSDTLYCDSSSLSFVLKLKRIIHSRLHGPNFMEHVLLSETHYSVMIIGGSENAHKRLLSSIQTTVLVLIAEKLRK